MLCEIEIMIDIDFDMVQWYRSVIAIAQHRRPVTWKAEYREVSSEYHSCVTLF